MRSTAKSLAWLLAVALLQAWTSGCFTMVGGLVGGSIYRYEQVGGKRFVREARRGQELRIRVRAMPAAQISGGPKRVRPPRNREVQIEGRYLGHDPRLIWLQREDDRRVSISVATVRRIERKTDETYLGEGVALGLVLDLAVSIVAIAALYDNDGWSLGEGSWFRDAP